MYREAIAKRRKGAVTAASCIIVFAAVMLILALKEPLCWVIFGICLLFAGLLIFSVVQTNNNLRKMEESYPGSLELAVDSCTEQVAGKYFFLETHLADPFYARLISYDDIASVKTVEHTDRRREGQAKGYRESRSVLIHTKSEKPGSMPIIFNDFCDSMARSDRQTTENYESFIRYLTEKLGGDAEITVQRY